MWVHQILLPLSDWSILEAWPNQMLGIRVRLDGLMAFQCKGKLFEDSTELDSNRFYTLLSTHFNGLKTER